MDFRGGDSGGGFSSGGNDFGGGSQGTPGKQRRNYDEQTQIPVTIAMAFKARGGDEMLMLEDGRALHTIKIVAAVRNVEVQSTNILYTIEDGTGCINVKQWLDDNDSAEVAEMKRQAAKDGIYIKVIGQIKDYDGQKQIVASSIQQLSSGNELTHHLLHVVYSSEKFKKSDSIVAAPAMVGNGMAFGNNHSVQPKMEGGGDIKDRVLQFLRQHDNDSETGVPIELCIEQMKDVSQAAIREAAEGLSEEGQIYSTINESFFKVAM